MDHELTAPVQLCTPRGRLNPAAVGWTRRPLHTANLRGWGRTKRWEYWCLVTPRHVIALTVSSLDYVGLHAVYVLDRTTGVETERTALEPAARSVRMPDRSAAGPTRAQAGAVALEFVPQGASVRLRAAAPGVRLRADVGPGQDCLGVVVPWSRRLFQLTVKDVGRPVSGTLVLGEQEVSFGSDGSFAVLDHGRGRWPYAATWNWAAGYGAVLGRRVGLQLGGRWTDGTGTTENALFVDGRIHRLPDALEWHYDRTDWAAPWRIRGPRVEVTLAPFHERRSRTNLLVVGSEVHQCFGRFTGAVVDDSGHRVPVDGLVGWAEEARNRW